MSATAETSAEGGNSEQATPIPEGGTSGESSRQHHFYPEDDNLDNHDVDVLKAQEFEKFDSSQEKASKAMISLEGEIERYEKETEPIADYDDAKRKKAWTDFRKIVESKTPEVHSAMHKYEHHPGIQERGCRLLRLLAPYLAIYDHTPSKKATNTGEPPLIPTSPLEGASISLLLACIRSNRDVTTVIAQTCAALEAICRSKDANKVRVASDYRGVQVVCLHVLRRHPHNATMQKWGCAVLAALIEAKTRSTREGNRERVLRSGGVAYVLEAMKVHPDSAKLQLSCLTVLAALCHGEGANNPRSAVGTEGGASSILEALRRHSSNPHVAEKGCAALWHVTEEPFEVSNRTLVVAEGGVDLVLNAMKNYPDDADVQRSACGCLSSLAARHNPHRVHVAERGVDLVIGAMSNHANSAEVQEWAARALWTMAVDHGNKDKVVSSGGIVLLLKAIPAYPDNVSILRNCCGCLWNLARASEEYLKMMIEEDGLKVIQEAADLHSTDLCKILLQKLKSVEQTLESETPEGDMTPKKPFRL